MTGAGLEPPPEWRETQATWGLQAIGCLDAQATGRGVRVAVLDTGMDTDHPDFRSRSVEALSMIPGISPLDVQGHGTHCIGTACGPRRSEGKRPAYGVAPEAEILSVKVLDDSGQGRDRFILEGMEAALDRGADVLSMSLGRWTYVGEPPSAAYAGLVREALNEDALVIAAAGNDSYRPRRRRPLSSPANVQGTLAVAALDQDLKVAYFSNAAIDPRADRICCAAPGVDVLSAVPRSRGLYRRLSGTSMAASGAGRWRRSCGGACVPCRWGRRMWAAAYATGRNRGRTRLG
jgi:subtilisin family serine protease